MPFFQFENLKRPLRPTDTQVQRCDRKDTVAAMLHDAARSKEARGKEYIGYQLNICEDGAGDKFYNVTVYFGGPHNHTTLDPNNLNGAEQAVLGQVLSQEELTQKGIGLRDRRA